MISLPIVYRFRHLLQLNGAQKSLPLTSQLFQQHNQHFSLSQRQYKDKEESKSFALNIFSGKLALEQLFPYPCVLNDDQKELLKQMIEPTEKFMTNVNNAEKNDKLGYIGKDILQQLGEMGAFGLQVPESLGGIGLSNTQYTRMVSIVGAADLGVGITLGAHQSIGFKGILLRGTSAQKEKYLPDLAEGRKMAAFCLTEASTGSDAASVQCKAVKSSDGSHYILNGTKIWISNGGIADIFTVFAKSAVVDPNSAVSKDKITAFIVERAFGGVTSSSPEDKMGIKGSNTASVYFENCKVPAENVLGNEGDGFKIAMDILNNGRFGMAGALSGTMKHCIEVATNFANERVQFGDKIKNYGIIQDKLCQMVMKHYITESMAYHVSGIMDQGYKDFQIEAAISKIYGSEAAWFCADEAIQICGGQGFMKSTGLERVLRDLRIFRIFEGTNDILRLFVSLTSMKQAGEALKNIKSDPMALVSFMSNRVRNSLGYGPSKSLVDGAPFLSVVHADLLTPAKHCLDSVNILTSHTQALLVKYKKDIINRQLELQMLANIAIECYAMGVGLSRASDTLTRGLSSGEYESKMIKLYCARAHNSVESISTQLQSKYLETLCPLTKDIANDLCQNGGVIQSNPLGF